MLLEVTFREAIPPSDMLLVPPDVTDVSGSSDMLLLLPRVASVTVDGVFVTLKMSGEFRPRVVEGIEVSKLVDLVVLWVSPEVNVKRLFLMELEVVDNAFEGCVLLIRFSVSRLFGVEISGETL